MKLLSVNSPEFAAYGKVLSGLELAPLLEALAKTPVPEDVVYVASAPELEATASMDALQTVAFGELPIQVGYCNGHNHLLNAVEYHRCSELNIAATDAILLLGRQQDIAADFTYETAKMEAFLLPAGTGVEIYGTTLHYAPCSAAKGAGFRALVTLPRGTNGPRPALTPVGPEDAYLTACNKWLLAHPESGEAKGGAKVGLAGANIDIADIL